MYMLGSSAPITFPEADIRAVLVRPGVLADISSAFDAPAKTVDDWVDVIARQTWLTDDGRPGVRRPGSAHHRRPPAPRVFPAPAAVRLHGALIAASVADPELGRR